MTSTNNNLNNHTLLVKNFQLSLPMNVEVLVGMEESVRTLIKITERLDYTKLNSSYKRMPHENQATPKQMFQLIVLGFMLRTYSYRQLESSCRNDIRFMYILKGKPAPDHNRFYNFCTKRLCDGVIEHLFYQLIFYLKECGEIDFENLFVDGTKIEANANKYTFVWKRAIDKFEARLDVKMDDQTEYLKKTYPEFFQVEVTLTDVLSSLKKKVEEDGVVFVHGKGKRKTPLQKDIEQLTEYLEKKQEYLVHRQNLGDRNSYSKTDKDATFMRMKDDHMRNGQLKPGYNFQIGVEGEYIIGLDVSDKANDMATLIPLLDRIEAGTGLRHTNIIADAGYESEENYKALETNEQTAYIKPANYEQMKKRKNKKDKFKRENMPYDPETDTYICPNGKVFELTQTIERKSKSGYVSQVSVYEAKGCNGCPLKPECTKAKENRKMQVSKDFILLRQRAHEMITTEKGIELRTNRSIQVEGAFGVLKQDYEFRRFSRRGRKGIELELFLYAFAFNINKKHNKNKRDFTGTILHEVMVS